MNALSTSEFDRRFDAGEDFSAHLDLSRARRPGRELRRVDVDFPVWMIESLDRDLSAVALAQAGARRLGVTRQSIIKVWLAERLEREAPGESSNEM